MPKAPRDKPCCDHARKAKPEQQQHTRLRCSYSILVEYASVLFGRIREQAGAICFYPKDFIQAYGFQVEFFNQVRISGKRTISHVWIIARHWQPLAKFPHNLRWITRPQTQKSIACTVSATNQCARG